MSAGTTPVIDLLRELIAINSVNCSMAASPGELALAQRVADLGRAAGADVRLEEVLPGRPNAWVILPATASAPAAGGVAPRRLLFDVHLDTVPLEPMPDALSPRLEAGRVWGRGACDTKAALAAVLVAIQRLAVLKQRNAEICLLASVDEEFQKRGVAHAVAGGLTATAAIVGEPTRLQPIVAHKGAVRWRITTLGKAAHTSRPEYGNNAIYQMVEVIRLLRERLEPKLALERHPLLTPPTLTVGRIDGGIGVNIVPERCVIEIDRRTLPREEPDIILAEVDALLDDLMVRDSSIRVRRDPPFLSERGLETPAGSAVVQALQHVCRAVCGPAHDLTPRGVPYGTDGTHLSGGAGIPTVVFGPGDIAQAHSADEWVEAAQVEQAAEIYYRLAAGFVAGEW